MPNIRTVTAAIEWARQHTAGMKFFAVVLREKAKAAARLTERIEAARKALESNPELLKDQPHPSQYRQGVATLRDYAEFLLKNGGAAGRGRGAKIVLDAVG